MGLECMSLVTVSGEPFAAQLLAVIVGGYKLCDPWESLGAGGDLIAKIDQQVTWLYGVVLTTNGHWRGRFASRVCAALVRYEAAIAKRPQELVKSIGVSTVAGLNMDGVLQPISFLCQAACERLT